MPRYIQMCLVVVRLSGRTCPGCAWSCRLMRARGGLRFGVRASCRKGSGALLLGPVRAGRVRAELGLSPAGWRGSARGEDSAVRSAWRRQAAQLVCSDARGNCSARYS